MKLGALGACGCVVPLVFRVLLAHWVPALGTSRLSHLGTPRSPASLEASRPEGRRPTRAAAWIHCLDANRNCLLVRFGPLHVSLHQIHLPVASQGAGCTSLPTTDTVP